MKITSELKNAIVEEIKFCVDARLNDPEIFGGTKVIFPDGREVVLFVHLDRSQSTKGYFTPPWELDYAEVDAIYGNLSQRGFDIEDLELEELVKEYRTEFFPVYTERIPRDAFGGYVDIAAYKNSCSKEEFEEAVNTLAPRLWGYGNKEGPELPAEIKIKEEF